MNQSPVSFIKAGDRVLTLSRPVLPHAARRLAETLPQLNALNTAGKSQADAAEALNVSVGAVRTWIALAGITWTNLKRRGPYAKRLYPNRKWHCS
jgi:hypothetical protein